MNLLFFFQNAMLGVGLAMDAFSVSLANGLKEPCMRRRRAISIAGIFALFQALMPLVGWFCVHTMVQYFKAFQPFIPWIALILLCFIGGKMILGALTRKDCTEDGACPCERTGFLLLLGQAVATSIDALSVGFTISEYGPLMAVVAALIIAAVTFFICLGGVAIGRKFGTILARKADLLGGSILIMIGFEIFITSFF